MSDKSDKYRAENILADVPFSHLLTDDQRRQLEENLNFVRFKRKEMILRQNTRIYNVMLIRSGHVKIFKEGRNEKTVILKVAGEGEFVGLMSVFGNTTHQFSASAVSESEICEIDTGHLRNVMMENGKFAFQFLNLLSMEGLFIFDRLMGQAHKQLPGRIADVILYFARDVYKSETFSFPFTRKELAELAGTTKESFIRTLAEFRNDKIIDIDGSVIRIKSMDIIRTLSELG